MDIAKLSNSGINIVIYPKAEEQTSSRSNIYWDAVPPTLYVRYDVKG